MKSIIAVVLSVFLAAFMVGCSADNLPFLNRDTPSSKYDGELKYKVEKVILSKGFQSIEPKVEVVKSASTSKLLISLGLIESSGVSVDKVVKNGNIINIHVLNESNKKDSQLTVPQIIMNLTKTPQADIEDIKFNIINENYKPLSLKLSANDVINKVKTDFFVVSNNSPELNLNRIDDSFIWEIKYNNIFDRNNIEIPLVNLTVEINGNSGEIISSRKGFISSLIDEGIVLDYFMEKSLLYRKNHIDPVTSQEVQGLWIYDIDKDEKNMIYQSNFNLVSASISPDYTHVFFIEDTGKSKDVYVFSLDENKTYKLMLENVIPAVIRWRADDELVILDNTNISNIYSYNLNTSQMTFLNRFSKVFTGLRVFNDHFILMCDNGNSDNRNIYYSYNLEDISYIDSGFMPRFINEDIIAYINKNEKNDEDHIILHDISKNKAIRSVNLANINTVNFSVLDENHLFIIGKNSSGNDFSVYEYDMDSKDLTFLTSVNNQNIFYNKTNDKIYVDGVLPFETNNAQIIFSVDLNKDSNLLSTSTENE